MALPSGRDEFWMKKSHCHCSSMPAIVVSIPGTLRMATAMAFRKKTHRESAPNIQHPRSKVVIFSKCFMHATGNGTQPPASAALENDGENVNLVDLSRKHIFDAVEASVKRLGTYIHVLQIHRLDRATPKKEIMRALNDVVEKGWVRRARDDTILSRSRGGDHSVVADRSRGTVTTMGERTTVREKADPGLKRLVRSSEDAADKATIDRVEGAAKKHGVSMTCIATSWSIKQGHCPIIGLNSKERIEEAVHNSEFQLSDEDAKYLEEPYVPKAVIRL
ncbi:hypothetical protein BST61_g8044 [Cercospora zeina]